ncbi:hypothetical protein [Neobacillus niacini]|uniref:hypothetical protein n=1 Tax=Neobacillus niacini TaxID=86668 RepID=UPI001C8E2A4F|nr:hypothetical protein [Neobacillus niacini]MBY0145070.1 hypothetical protein [Neobacillus niacini]
MSVKQHWKDINIASEKVSSLINSYWHEHSDWGNWQFWVVLLCLLIPLIVLLIKLDRNRTFEILFFGFTVHMLWTYTDLLLIRLGYIDHHYFLMPFLPQALGITAAIIPVSFMLLYQYCLNQEKPFIIWTTGLSAIIAFGFAPIEMLAGFVSIYQGFNIVHLFFIDGTISMIAYGMTKFFVRFYMAR